MKKNLLIIFLIPMFFEFIFSSTSKNIENEITTFLDSQFVSLYEYKNFIYQKENFFLQIKQLENKWMPNVSFSASSSYGYNPLESENLIHGFNYNSSLNFSQKIPLGILFNADLFSFSGNLKEQEILHQYNYIGKLEFSIPLMNYLFGFAESLIYVDKCEKNNYKNYIDLYLKLNKQKMYNLLTEYFGNYLYHLSRIEFYQKKEMMLSNYQKDIESLFSSGQVSFSEIISVKKQIIELKNSMNNEIQEINLIKNNLENFGCDISNMKFDLSQWMIYCKSLENNSCLNFREYDFEFYQLQQQWINAIKSYTKSFPNLSLSLTTTPLGKNKSYSQENSSMLESFSYYWGTVDSCKINLSLSMKFSLMEYDAVYTNKRIFENEKKRFEINLNSLSERRKNEIDRRKKDLAYYLAQVENSYQIFLQEKEVAKSYEELYKNDFINKYDLLNFQFYIEELYLDYVKKYLVYINFLLSCF